MAAISKGRKPNHREVSYDAMKNSITSGSNNAIPIQVPLKGAAIFLNGNTGYSLLYLAKQTGIYTKPPYGTANGKFISGG
ncbi:MAG: hypothetical protein ACJ71J_00985 [Nitrososphaeraceae archaeon]